MKFYVIAILMLMISPFSSGQSKDSSIAKDEELIKKVLTDFTDAWNKHDAKAFSNVFTEDADFTNVAGRGASGTRRNRKVSCAAFYVTIQGNTPTNHKKQDPFY